MKGKINLLYKARSYKKREHLFEQFKKVVLGVGILTLSIMGIILLLQAATERQYKNLLASKERLIAELLPTKETERKLLFIQDRAHNFETITRAKAYFGNYYRFLHSTQGNASESSTLSDFSIDSKNAFSATFDFSNSEDALSFMSIVESKEFSDAFGEAKVGTITISNDTSQKQGSIQITISGKTKQTL